MKNRFMKRKNRLEGWKKPSGLVRDLSHLITLPIRRYVKGKI